MPKPARGTFDCPICGEQVRQGARSCPECGADEETGWSEDTMYDGLNLPDPGYGPDIAESGAASERPRGRIYRAVAIIILILIVAFGIRWFV